MAAKNKAVEPEETGTQDNHATVVAQAERKSVVFLGPHHRYSRGDIACFEAAYRGMAGGCRTCAETEAGRQRF